MTQSAQRLAMANAIRFLSADAVQKAGSGHPGMPMGMADVATALFSRFLKFDASAPRWPDRDRFVLSAGHGSMLLYSLGYLLGYEDVSIDQLKSFRQMDSITAGHPEYGLASLVETTTGPLGQGVANAVGLALAEKILTARHGEGLINHKTYVVAGDGCLMEGLSQEAISLAGHWRLNKLILLWDDNNITIDGDASLAVSDDVRRRFKAAQWRVLSCDGHNPDSIDSALAAAQTSEQPTMIACKTIIGFGAPTAAGAARCHGAPLGTDELVGAREALDWPYEPFAMSEDILSAWRAAGVRGAEKRRAWERKLAAATPEARDALNAALSGRCPPGWDKELSAMVRQAVADKTATATRQASQMVLDAVASSMPSLIGGSADLTSSNLTMAVGMTPISADHPSGSYLRYGVREHGMASIMNGLALHGFIPYGGTFLAFSDYARPAMRMAALMGLRVIYVMTHDSIGLGEDGPTHQPIEQLASLRAMPNLLVLRPADVVETAECWRIALENTASPSVLALSRQKLPLIRDDIAVNRSAAGGYVLAEANGNRDTTLIATGSEVHVALRARALLASCGVKAAVVSMPCAELFDAQPTVHRQDVLGDAPRVAIEAATTFGWERYIGDNGLAIGLNAFGASAPASDLFERFGLTAEAAAEAALTLVQGRARG